MNPKIGITSLSVTKLTNEQSGFVKYNIESSIDEIENTETEVELKYKFTLLSNPTNTKISIEGVATIYGNQVEVSHFFIPDERKIPRVVNNIYQEIFPLFYILSKSVQIPCPAYKLSEITAQQIEPGMTRPVSDHVLESPTPDKPEELSGPETMDTEQIESEPSPLQEQLIEKRSV